MDLGESTVLVTGARGFIGGHLLRRLVGLGARVHAVSRDGAPRQPDVRWWRRDMCDGAQVEDLVQRVAPDVVFHLASVVAGARDPALVAPMFRANLAGVVHLLASTQRLGGTRVVLAGSMEEPRADESASSPYAAAKGAATEYARMYRDLWQLPVTTLRISMVYGPGQPDLRKVVPYVITSLAGGRPPRLSSGRREIDWVYVDDVVDAFLAAAAAPPSVGGAFDIGSGVGVSIRDTVARIGRLMGTTVQPRFDAGADRPRDTARIADPSAALASLGWRPATGLDDGLTRTIRWYTAPAGYTGEAGRDDHAHRADLGRVAG